MTLDWRIDRRGLLKASGGLLAGLGSARISWAEDGSTLRLRAASDLQVLDPKTIIGELDDIIPRCTQVTLVKVGDVRNGNLVSNYAADKLDWIAPDQLAFTLRDGMTWNNGFGPVTADDVKYSFERIAGTDSPWAYQFEKMEKVEVKDARSGIIHLKQPFIPFLYIALPYYGGHIVCKAAVEKAGGSYTTSIPAQCGPYLLDSWQQGQKATLIANPDWKGEKPAFNKIEYYIVTDDQAALLAYQADAFDFTRVALSSAKQVKSAPPPGATLIESQSTRYVWLTINMNAEALKDIRVRQAIQYAIDPDAVLVGAYDGLVPRSAGVVQPGPYSRSANKISRDVEKAKALLAEAGVSNLTLKLLSLTESTATSTCQIIQASLAEAGITVELQPTESATYWATGDKTQGDAYKSLELALMNFAGGIDPTENLVWFRPNQIGAYNWSFFDNAEFEDLYQKSTLETDMAKRKAMFNRMEDVMEESGCFVFLCFEPYLAIHDSTLKPVILADGHPDPTQFTKA